MKRIVSFMLCAIMSISVMFAQGKSEATFDKTVHDFGKVSEEEGNISCEFIIKNTGDAPLVISRVNASCGCTTPDWTKAPIAPGATGFVKATYGAKGRPGPFSKTVSVYTNAKDNAYVLTIKGDVIPKPQDPESAYPVSMGDLRLKRSSANFNNLRDTETRSEVIEVYNQGKTTLQLGFGNLPKYITAVANPSSLEAGKMGIITISYNGPEAKKYGTFTDKMNILVNSKQNINNYVTINSTLVQDFSKMTETEKTNAPVMVIEPSSLNFNDIAKTKSMNLTITNSGKSNLVIYNIQSTLPEVFTVASHKKEIKPGKSEVFKVTVSSNLTKGSSAYINIASNDPKAGLKGIRAIASVPAK